MNENQQRLFLSLDEKLGKTKQTLYGYIRSQSYPADICLLVERLTGGELKAVTLRPDLFSPTKDQRILASLCLNTFDEKMSDKHFELFVGALNFLELEQPSIYSDLLTSLKRKHGDVAKLFLKERTIQRNERS